MKPDQAAGFAFQGKETTIFEQLFSEFIKLIKLIYFYIDVYLIDLPEVKL